MSPDFSGAKKEKAGAGALAGNICGFWFCVLAVGAVRRGVCANNSTGSKPKPPAANVRNLIMIDNFSESAYAFVLIPRAA